MTKLRALEPDDIDLLFTVENDLTLWKVGDSNVPYSREFLRNYILSTTGDIFSDKQLRLVVEYDNKPAGLIDLTSFSPLHRRAEVGIAILKEFRQRGIGMEAVSQLERYAAEFLHIHQLYAIIPEDNTPCLDLFEKCSFECKSTLKDWLIDGQTYKNAFVYQKMI